MVPACALLWQPAQMHSEQYRVSCSPIYCYWLSGFFKVSTSLLMAPLSAVRNHPKFSALRFRLELTRLAALARAAIASE